MIQRRPLAIVGMVGPKAHPDAHGFRAGDSHVIVNDARETATAWSYSGAKHWELPALARGQGGDREWNRVHTDTPPGLYLSGAVYRDWEANRNPPLSPAARSFGWVSIDLIELEDQELRYGRAGMMVHGGGSFLGWPGAWQPLQSLGATYGCVRMHNIHLQDRVLPLFKAGRVFWSVYQEA